MSSDAQRKQRKRLKREQKKSAIRRAMSVSPYKRIGQSGEVQACYINSNWSDSGLASIYVVRRNPAGGLALACFLVDVWCSGLKDASGRVDLAQEDIKLNLDRARENFELTRIEIETAQRLIASAIRFSRQNGFRLPEHYERWVNLAGGVGDVAQADLSGFGKDGKLVWVGSFDELRKRLVGSTVEEFVARPDVQFAVDAGSDSWGPYEPSDPDLEVSDEEFPRLAADFKPSLLRVADRMAEAVQEMMLAEQQEIPERSVDVVRFFFVSEFIREESRRRSSNEAIPPLVRILAEAAKQIFRDLGFDERAESLPASLIEAGKRIRPFFDRQGHKEKDNLESMLAMADELEPDA